MPKVSLYRHRVPYKLRHTRNQGRYSMLEPCEAKVSRTVLRAGGGSNPASLTRRSAQLRYRGPFLREDSSCRAAPAAHGSRWARWPPAASAPPSSLLRQEVQERLVEGCRILVGHEVRGLGNDHQATTGNALHEHLIAQRRMPSGVFAAHDQGGALQAPKRGAGD